MPKPLYTRDNCGAAYQLHWSLSRFTTGAMPPGIQWKDKLSAAIEPDGLRLLEVHPTDTATVQFFLSTKPEVAPSEIVRSVKARLQVILRPSIPKLWQRQYSIASVGDAKNEVLQGYLAKQVEHHQIADPRTAERLSQAQFHDEQVDLGSLRSSSHGQLS